MQSTRGYQVVPLRLLTLILGAIFTLIITKKLIATFGIEGYATYAVLTAIPSLIPFADLGLGLGVFNSYARHQLTTSLPQKAKEQITLAFYLICTFAILAISISFILIKVYGLGYLFYGKLTNLNDNNALLILCFTFLSSPLTLGFRKMYATGKVLPAIILSFLIPLTNLILTFYFISISNYVDQWVVLAPSTSYLIANLLTFKIEKIHKDFVRIRFSNLKTEITSLLKYALTSTLFISLIALILQLPKFYFAHQNAQMNVAKYSILLIITSSLGSLISAYSSILVPNYKKFGITPENLSKFLPNYRHSFFISFFLILLYFYGPLISDYFFKINFSRIELLVSGVGIIFYLFWVFYNSFVTEAIDLKILFITGFISFIVTYSILLVLEPNSFSICITLMFLQIFAILLFASIYRIFYFKENFLE